MSKHTSDNLRIKRKHLVWLKDAKGLSQSSIDKAAASIAIYDAVESLDYSEANFYSLTLLILCFVILMIVNLINRKTRLI